MSDVAEAAVESSNTGTDNAETAKEAEGSTLATEEEAKKETTLATEGSGAEGEGKKEEKEIKKKAPEKYEDFDMKGLEMSEEAVKLITDTARELDLTQEQAQKLFDARASLAREEAKAIEGIKQEWRKETEALPEFAKNKEYMRRGMQHASAQPGMEEFRSFLNESGLGNHPIMFNLLSLIGKGLSDEEFIGDGDSGTKVSEKSAAEIMYPDLVPKKK